MQGKYILKEQSTYQFCYTQNVHLFIVSSRINFILYTRSCMGDNTSTLCGRFSPAQFVGRGVIPMMQFSGVHGRCILQHPLSLAVVSAT